MFRNKYLISSVLFPLIDFFYLKLISKHYNKVVKNITGKNIKLNYPKAIIAYVILSFGLNYFIISKLNDGNINQQLINAAFFGLVVYGTFDFTTGAIFSKYDYYTMIIDTLWGGILNTLITILTYHIAKINP